LKKLSFIITTHQYGNKNEPAIAHKAVQEAEKEGIYTYCINLDSHADDYVGQYLVIDRVERLPEQLPKLFLSLTG